MLKELVPNARVQGHFAENRISIFWIFALPTCKGRDFPSYHLYTAVCPTCGKCGTTFYAVLLTGLSTLFLSLQNKPV